MNITYYLGAGASFNAVPIVGQLENVLELIQQMAGEIQKDLLREDPTLNNQFETFKNFMATGSKESKRFGTIDTYAKHLWLTNNKSKLRELKESLSLFFCIWQELDKEHFNQYLKEKMQKFENIDHRYLGLTANYLERKNEGVGFSDNIKFITWNYDSQLEQALSIFTGTNDIEQTLEKFVVYPFIYEDFPKKPSIIHLNGIAGLYGSSNSKSTKTLFDRTSTKDIQNVLKETLFSVNSNTTTNDKYFSFAWEDDNISTKAIELAENVLRETDILVIIGYSFPTFNDKVDKRLMHTLSQNKRLSRIYFQDPNADKELLTNRFDIKQENITVLKSTLQFALPLEFMNKYSTQEKIEIISAKYGAPMIGFQDVKERVQKLVDSGYLQGPVDPSTFDIQDPGYGIVKEFRVNYKVFGKEKTKNFKDGQFFLFD